MSLCYHFDNSISTGFHQGIREISTQVAISSPLPLLHMAGCETRPLRRQAAVGTRTWTSIAQRACANIAGMGRHAGIFCTIRQPTLSPDRGPPALPKAARSTTRLMEACRFLCPPGFPRFRLAINRSRAGDPLAASISSPCARVRGQCHCCRQSLRFVKDCTTLRIRRRLLPDPLGCFWALAPGRQPDGRSPRSEFGGGLGFRRRPRLRSLYGSQNAGISWGSSSSRDLR